MCIFWICRIKRFSAFGWKAREEGCRLYRPPAAENAEMPGWCHVYLSEVPTDIDKVIELHLEE